jgi:hypothetical protein
MVFVETEQSLLVCCSTVIKTGMCQSIKSNSIVLCNNVRWTVFISSVTGVVDYENLSGKLE